MSKTATETDDIQALVRGFDTLWPWGKFVFFSLGDDPADNRAFIGDLDKHLGNEQSPGPTSIKILDEKRKDSSFTHAYNVALSYPALRKMAVVREVRQSFPTDFIQGMRDRYDINGDDGTSSPTFWEDHWQDRNADVWVAIYARTESQRDSLYQSLRKVVDAHNVTECGSDDAHRFVSDATPVWIDDEGSQPAPGKILEHFGFQGRH